MSDNDEEISENEGLNVDRHARNTTTTTGSKKKHRTAKGRVPLVPAPASESTVLLANMAR